jgi:hypothetical protein
MLARPLIRSTLSPLIFSSFSAVESSNSTMIGDPPDHRPPHGEQGGERTMVIELSYQD